MVVLPEYGTLLPKNVGDTSLIFIYNYYYAFWYNKLSTLIQ